jgi:hypothetical protein
MSSQTSSALPHGTSVSRRPESQTAQAPRVAPAVTGNAGTSASHAPQPSAALVPTRTTTQAPGITRTSPPAPQPNEFPRPRAPPSDKATTGPDTMRARKNQQPQSIPPPPRVGQAPRADASPPRSTKYAANPYHSTRTDEPAEVSRHSLEHPPGYRQNPNINCPPGALSQRRGYSYSEGGGGGGRWRWDDAPGGAGGRYEYTDDDDDDDDGGGGGDADDWPGSGLWDATLSWASTMGLKLQDAEEGIWRWVNSKK